MVNCLNEIRQEGLKALSSKLGAAGAVVFMRQFESGYGDYTEERESNTNLNRDFWGGLL